MPSQRLCIYSSRRELCYDRSSTAIGREQAESQIALEKIDVGNVRMRGWYIPTTFSKNGSSIRYLYTIQKGEKYLLVALGHTEELVKLGQL